MAVEQFTEYKPRAEALSLIQASNAIIRSYAAQGLRLTLRQLYYQHVSANTIPNSERSYQNLSSLISKARLGGLMDWDAIEDRGRRPHRVSEFEDLKDLVEAAIRSYRLPRWQGQGNYVELWVEKDALAGVLSPVARDYHVTMMVNKGYSSQSAMYESANRFRDKQDTRACWLFYLGDHDPSGEDMVRDIRDRMGTFGVTLVVHKIALTMAQVKQYNPPPNPAKITDPRATEYIKKHGASSWEVDALPPQVLQQLIRQSLDTVTDKKTMQIVKDREEVDKEDLRKSVEKLIKKNKPLRIETPDPGNAYDNEDPEDDES